MIPRIDIPLSLINGYMFCGIHCLLVVEITLNLSKHVEISNMRLTILIVTVGYDDGSDVHHPQKMPASPPIPIPVFGSLLLTAAPRCFTQPAVPCPWPAASLAVFVVILLSVWSSLKPLFSNTGLMKYIERQVARPYGNVGPSKNEISLARPWTTLLMLIPTVWCVA